MLIKIALQFFLQKNVSSKMMMLIKIIRQYNVCDVHGN